MGLEDREYLRDEARRYGEGGGGVRFGLPGGGFSGEWAVRVVLITNIVVFLLQHATIDSPVTSWLRLDWDDVAAGQVWRLLTYGFCHNNLLHILFNMYLFWIFGKRLEGIYGSREFLSFYLSALIFSGLCHLGYQLATGRSAGVIGASGGVFAVEVLAAMHFPTMIMLFMFVFPMQLRHMVMIFIGIDLLAFSREDGIARAAHLGGAAFGYFYYRGSWRIFPLFGSLASPVATLKSRWRNRRRKQQLQIFEPNDDELQQELDRILAKIKAEGEAGLSREERATLERASRYFRGR
jgi:membrane associated rhomboid family serine protease